LIGRHSRRGCRRGAWFLASQLLDYAPYAAIPADRLTALFPEEPDISFFELLYCYGVGCVFRAATDIFTRIVADDDIRSHMRQRWPN